MNKVYILAVLALWGQSCLAQIRDFQTTRLNSTAGAGVASILSTEAAILNPAVSAFFDGSSFSYQSYSTALKKESALRRAAGNHFPKNSDSRGAFVADHSGPMKGGVAYIQQKENDYERERVILHGAVPMGASAAMGISYQYLQDEKPPGSSTRHAVHHQARVGTSFILDQDTILGVVIVDPTRTTPGEERALAGFQYTLADRFVIIGDVGMQYTKAYNKQYLWRGALQLNIFEDFFFRVGRFYDNIRENKGTGWGAAWIGPRFGVEFAQQISEQFRTNYIYEGEHLVDTSLSAIIKF